MKEVEKINLYIKCPFSIPEKITAINHIDNDLLEWEGMEEIEAFERIKNFIRAEDIIAGYNSKAFDEKFLDTFYAIHGHPFVPAVSIDVYHYAKHIVAPEHVLVKDDKTGQKEPSYKLAIVVGFYDSENKYKFDN